MIELSYDRGRVRKGKVLLKINITKMSFENRIRCGSDKLDRGESWQRLVLIATKLPAEISLWRSITHKL